MVTLVGQRRFLLKEGYTDAQLDIMSPSTARYIISQIERERARQRQKEEDEAKRKATYMRVCLVCNEWTSVNYDEYNNFPVSICEKCKNAIMIIRTDIENKEH